MLDPIDPPDSHAAAFSQAMDDCLELYRSSAEIWTRSLPAEASARTAASTLELMEDLARGLIVKIFLTIMQADGRFTSPERNLAQVLLLKLWGRTFLVEEIGAVMQELVPLADKFDWYRLLRPFENVPALRDRVGEVETVVMRLANLVAKADGTLAPEEAVQLKGLLAEIYRHLRPVPIESSGGPPPPPPPNRTSNRHGQSSGLEAIDPFAPAENRVQDAMAQQEGARQLSSQVAAEAQPSKEERLKAALASLDELIGLNQIKIEVRELIRFLQVQQHRQEAGLPRTQVSLHTVFAGNPGTGKTSVARILGEVFGALGVVSSGHLIEADRSALVAGYMGQTAERTNRIVDQALNGVLFIDEAYSLINEEGEDPYGHEAVQILLKRMEDDRHRLIVVLAGYSAQMERLLASNPGLSSRFNRTFAFPDYAVVELCRIFHSLCEKNHYVLPAETRARLLLGFEHLLAERDEHFGNGRLMRNVFEQAIRRLANRVADIVPLTTELLTRMEPGDIQLSGVPESIINAEATEKLYVSVTCTGCQQVSRLKATNLGRRAQCKKCQIKFTADWGMPIR